MTDLLDFTIFCTFFMSFVLILHIGLSVYCLLHLIHHTSDLKNEKTSTSTLGRLQKSWVFWSGTNSICRIGKQYKFQTQYREIKDDGWEVIHPHFLRRFDQNIEERYMETSAFFDIWWRMRGERGSRGSWSWDKDFTPKYKYTYAYMV